MARWIRESRRSPSVASPRTDSEFMNTDSDHDPRTFTVEQFPEEPEIWWQETARMFCTNKAAVAGAASLVLIVLVGTFGPIILAADPFAIVGAPLREPGDGTLLGTDYLGRDVFTGIVYGVRTTLAIAITATIFAVFVGITIGAVAGFYGGKIDNALMRVTEFFQVLPPLVFAMVIVAVFSHDLVTVIIAIGITTCRNPTAPASSSSPTTSGRSRRWPIGFWSCMRATRSKEGTLDEISDDARHPYTQGLLRSMPEIVDDPADVRVRLPEIPGTVPDLLRGLVGCPFAPRCPSAMSRCRELPGYSRLGDHRSVKCWLESDRAGDHAGP